MTDRKNLYMKNICFITSRFRSEKNREQKKVIDYHFTSLLYLYSVNVISIISYVSYTVTIGELKTMLSGEVTR